MTSLSTQSMSDSQASEKESVSLLSAATQPSSSLNVPHSKSSVVCSTTKVLSVSSSLVKSHSQSSSSGSSLLPSCTKSEKSLLSSASSQKLSYKALLQKFSSKKSLSKSLVVQKSESQVLETESSLKCLKKFKVKSVINSLSGGQASPCASELSTASSMTDSALETSSLRKSASLSSRDSVTSIGCMKGRTSLFYRRLDNYPRVKDHSLDGFHPFIGSLEFDDPNQRFNLNYIVKIDYSKPNESVAAAVHSLSTKLAPNGSKLLLKSLSKFCLDKSNKRLRKLKIKEIGSFSKINTSISG